MSFLKNLLGGGGVATGSGPRGKEGARAYAVGDIHGRLDLLEIILHRINEDLAGRAERRTFIVFLGDLIDRGPDSSGVVERLRRFKPEGATPVFLMGNHEEVFLSVLDGDRRLLEKWMTFGGAECVQSYGLDPGELKELDPGAAIGRLRQAVPDSHIDFVRGFADTFRFGDYLFVHAGVRPGLGLDEQERRDLRWIRDPFLSDANEHGFMVVHGHTISEAVEERSNRIGIDTGAYKTGILTALAIEGRERWYLATEASGGTL